MQTLRPANSNKLYVAKFMQTKNRNFNFELLGKLEANFPYLRKKK